MINELKEFFYNDNNCIVITRVDEFKIRLNNFYTLYCKEGKDKIMLKVSSNNAYTDFDSADFVYYSQITDHLKKGVFKSLQYIIYKYKHIDSYIELRGHY